MTVLSITVKRVLFVLYVIPVLKSARKKFHAALQCSRFIAAFVEPL